jgi:uncharacterized protein YkwD
MRRIGLIVLCLLVAGAAGGATTAAAHHVKRHKLCRNHHKRAKRCRPRKHRVGQAKHGAGQAKHGAGQTKHGAGQTDHGAGKTKQSVVQASTDPSRALPPLAQLIAPETACPGQSDESLSAASQEATMGCMINFVRSEAGEAGLAPVAPLDDSSDDKASDIIGCAEFSHTACGRAFTYWIEQDGYVQPGGCTAAGENIAWGTGELGTVRSILTAWVNSPDHLANILRAEYHDFGVGLEVGPLNGYPDAHVWVTHFGILC